MRNLKSAGIPACFLLCFSLIFISENTQAQKYKTASDTIRLNKEYAQLRLDIANLNSKLSDEKEKTADYQLSTSSTSDKATRSAQQSKTQAATATNGNTSDTRQAVRDAKRANRKARSARKAKSNEKDHNKRIKALESQIAKKQSRLRKLDLERAAIMTKLDSGQAG